MILEKIDEEDFFIEAQNVFSNFVDNYTLTAGKTFKNLILRGSARRFSCLGDLIFDLLRNQGACEHLVELNLSGAIGTILARCIMYKDVLMYIERHETVIQYRVLMEAMKVLYAIGYIEEEEVRSFLRESFADEKDYIAQSAIEFVLDVAVSEFYPAVVKRDKSYCKEVFKMRYQTSTDVRKLRYINLFSNLGDLDITLNDYYLSSEFILQQEGLGEKAEAIIHKCPFCDKEHLDKKKSRLDVCPFCGRETTPLIYFMK